MESMEKGLKLLNCAQIDFQCLFKSLKHSFKNHKDGYTSSSAFKINFLSEEIWIILKLCTALNLSIA